MAKKQCNHCKSIDDTSKQNIKALVARGIDLNRISAMTRVPLQVVGAFLDCENKQAAKQILPIDEVQ